MACTSGLCSLRDPLSTTTIGCLMVGTPLSIILNPISFSSWFSEPYTECVTSFCAVLKQTGKLVIVTIGDLLTPNPTYTKDRTDPLNVTDPYFDVNNQQYPYSFINGPRSTTQARVKSIGTYSKYNSLYKTPATGSITYNQVNAAIIYPEAYTNGSDTTLPINCTGPQGLSLVSWQNSYIYLFGDAVKLTEPFKFATTEEISTITPQTDIMIIGYDQLKQGDCGVKINSINATYTFSFSNVPGTFPFNELLSFTNRDSACGNPVMNKDKGAPILASIGGKWKIIGIVIGFNGATGYGSRIDYIADQLGIEEWDGSLKPFTNFSMIDYPPNVSSRVSFITQPGLNYISSVTDDGILYQQIGTSNLTL